MLTLDPTTLAEYDDFIEKADRAQAVLDAIANPVTVTVYDGTAQVMGQGTMQSPWATRAEGTITVAELASFNVLVSGSPDPATWYLRFESGGRYLQGTFGFAASGADFTWDRASWSAGQAGTLGTVACDAYDVPVVFGWTFAQGEGEAYDLGVNVAPGGTVVIPAHLYAIPPGETAVWSLLNQSDGTTITPESVAGEPVIITVGAQVPPTDSYTVLVDLSPVATEITTLGISGAGAWTFGQAFKQGDAPAYVAVSGGQAEVRNRWSDGSVKFAVLSGIASGAGSVSVTAWPSDTMSGTAVAEPTLAETSVDFGAYGKATLVRTAQGTWNKATAGRVRSIPGPVMSEFHYYAPAPSDAHLAVWWYVRAYSNGQVEVETVVENGWLMVTVTAPTQKDYTPTVRVNGAVVYSGVALNHYHHTRWSRADWTSGSSLTPTHVGAYLSETKLVPNYYSGAAGAGAWTKITNTSMHTSAAADRPAPLSLGSWDEAMGAGGEGSDDQKGPLPHWEALYCTTGDPRAYFATVGNGRLLGRYSVYYRDETTGKAPTPSTKGNLWYQSGDSNSTPTPTGGSNAVSYSHLPSWGYLPYLLTGRWHFWEMAESLALTNHFNISYLSPWPTSYGRGGNQGILHGEPRARGWGLLRRAQAACIVPDSETTAQYELCRLHGNNIEYLWQLQSGTAMANSLGVVFVYYQYANVPGADILGSAPWQQSFLTMAVAWARDLEVTPQSQRAAMLSLFSHACKHAIGLLGKSSQGGFNWRRWDVYEMSYGLRDADGSPASFYASWGALNTANLSNYGASELPDTDGLGVLQNTYTATSSATSLSMRSILSLGWAVDHGETGALEAWQRVTASSTWTAYSSSLATYPRYAVVPR